MLNRQSGAYAPVFYPSIILMVILASIGVIWPENARIYFEGIQDWLLNTVGWLYILGMGIFVCFSVFLMVSRLGDIKLGPDHSLPEHSNLSWFAMLFAAGMGIGLMFFSVAEPLQHYLAPPTVEASTVPAAINAMNITFFHWGMHAWAVYAVVGLSLAYFSYRHRLPLLPRSVLYPLIGKRIYGPIGHTVDVFAILGTMFGIATSLGLGAAQVNAGLNFLFGVPANSLVQSILIAVIISCATVSVALGLDKGIKVVSNFNIIVAICILLFILITGSTTVLFEDYVQNIGTYLSTIVQKTFNLYAYEHKHEWLSGWTLFYWGWWIAWSPFVGMFIARVSKGRTIREFLIGVLFIPTGFTFLWLTVFGNSAINILSSGKGAALIQAAENNIPIALFEFLHHFPFALFISVVALILIITFFVTSSDSGSLVVDILATGNAKHSIVWQRIFWSLLEGFLAISLLYSGGLEALQTATIASAFPFLIILFFMCIALVKALRSDHLKMSSMQTHTPIMHLTQADGQWGNRIDTLLKLPTQDEARDFLNTIVKPALESLHQKFKEKGIKSHFFANKKHIRLHVPKKEGHKDFMYSVLLREFVSPNYLYEDPEDKTHHYFRAEVFLEHGGQHYNIMGYSYEQVIADVINQYEKHLYFLHLSSSEERELIDEISK